MKAARLIRLCGLASALGGVLWIVLFLLRMSPEIRGSMGANFYYLVCVPLTLFVVGLVGLVVVLRASSADAAARSGGVHPFLKTAGLVLGFAGLAVAIAASSMFGRHPLGGWWYLTYVGGTMSLSTGMILLGIATVKTKVLPRWGASPLAVGLLGLAWLPFLLLDYFQGDIETSGSIQAPLTYAARALFGIGWLALAYTLWTTPFVWLEGRMEKLSGWMGSLAFFDILETLGKMAVLVAVIFYFAQYDDGWKQKQYAAWEAITSAHGPNSDGGRLTALQDLNRDEQNLAGVSVEDANLAGIHLPGARLDRARFQGTDLTGANLQDASLLDTDLDQVVLAPLEQGQRARLEDASLPWAKLRQADMREVEAQRATLDNAYLDGAILSDANLRNASLENANLPYADLSGIDLPGANLKGASMFQARALKEADFTEADLTQANLGWANFPDAKQVGARLIGADLTSADLSGASLNEADLEGAILSEATVGGGTDLRGAKNLTQEQVDAAIGDETTLLPAGLKRPEGWREAAGKVLPVEGEIPSGEYATDEFSWTFTLNLDAGWNMVLPEIDNALRIYSSQGDLSFLDVNEVIDYEEPGLETAVPAPSDVLGWFRDHPNLVITDPAPVDIKGVSGVVFDAYVSPEPDEYPNTICADPCVPLFPINDGTHYFMSPGTRERVILLDFAGEPVVIAFTLAEDAETGRLVAPDVSKVLDEMEWTNRFQELFEVSAGVQRTEEFAAPFSFETSRGWRAPEDDAGSYALAEDATSPKTLNFFTVQNVYDPNDPGTGSETSDPQNAEAFVESLENHPYLEVSEPSTKDVGGIRGMQMDVSVSRVPVDYDCADPCVPLFETDAGSFVFFERYRNRAIVLDVDGKIVLVSIESPARDFEEFVARAEEVLETVKWGG